jgi:hypothetical protein
MKPVLQLTIARAPVRFKEDAGYRRKPGGIMDVEVSFDLSMACERDALANVLKTKGYTVWRFDGPRSRANARSMSAVALDYDEGKTVDGLAKEFAEYIHVIAPTTRHTVDLPRFRVLLPLSTPADDSTKFAATRKWLINRFPDNDPKMLTISQPCFPCAEYYRGNDDEKMTSWAHTNFDTYFRVNTDGVYFSLPDEESTANPLPVDGGDKYDWPDLDPHLSKYRKELYCKSLDLLLAKGVKKSREGGRDNRAIVLASECRKCDFDIGEAGRLLSKWNELNDPPLTLDDLERVVRSAYTGEGYDFGESDDIIKKARKQARADIKKNGLQNLDDDDDNNSNDDNEEKDYKSPPSLAELMTDPHLTERPKTVGRWVSWRQRITLLVGSAKRSGKSTLCTYESLVVLDSGGTILWVSNDEPLSDVVRRFKEANVSDADAARVRVLHSEITGVMPKTWKGLYDVIIEVAPDIVVLDSIHTLFPFFSEKHEVPESHETALWQAETARLRSAALAADAAVVWIHHENKSGASAGSVGIEAAVDVIAHLRPFGKHSPNTRTLSFLGRFVGPSSNKILEYMNETDGYREIDLKDNDDSKNGGDKETEDWLLSQFNGVDEITSKDMNTRIKNVYSGRPQSAVWRRIRLVAQENLGITIGKSEGAFGTKTVWRMSLGADPKQFTKGENNDK